jgi:hypothetical protein
MKNGKLNASTERCRIKEFESLAINRRRVKATPDSGDESVWVSEHLHDRYVHYSCLDNIYNKPRLGELRSKILGVNPMLGIPVRY